MVENDNIIPNGLNKDLVENERPALYCRSH